MQQSKRCSKCGEMKPLTEYAKHKAWKDGLFPYCLPCKRAACRESHARNRDERTRITRSKYRANPEPAKEAARKYYAENREACLENVLAWQAKNADKLKAYSLEKRVRRKAREQTVPRTRFTPAQLEQRMSMFGNRCWVCGGPRQAVDHVKPLAKGGAHMLSNLRPICTSCNASKKDAWPFVKKSR